MRQQSHKMNFKGKRVIVMGLGRFGGGVGVTRWLLQAGANVVVTDLADADTLAASLEQVADVANPSNFRLVTGPHDIALLDEADVLVVNPAVPTPWKNSFVLAAIQRGLVITTEIEIAYRLLDPSRIVAITGSAGKSTTCAMLHHVLQATGFRSVLGGNIGGSLLAKIDNQATDAIIVLELSSAMLYWLWGRDAPGPPPGPQVGCVTNYTSNHIDWHASDEHYQQSKQLLVQSTSPQGTIILGASLAQWARHASSACHVMDHNASVEHCTVPGRHNATNAAIAVQLALAITQSTNRSAMENAVRSFTGLPHRLNLCHQANGIRFYNDSKSTVPQSACLAIEAVSEQVPVSSIHLICGGYDKGLDLSPISKLHTKLAGIYTIGDTASSITSTLNCGHLEQALQAALDSAQPGHAIVLSPGCASWDQFDNYEQRGNCFESLAKQFAQRESTSTRADRHQ